MWSFLWYVFKVLGFDTVFICRIQRGCFPRGSLLNARTMMVVPPLIIIWPSVYLTSTPAICFLSAIETLEAGSFSQENNFLIGLGSPMPFLLFYVNQHQDTLSQMLLSGLLIRKASELHCSTIPYFYCISCTSTVCCAQCAGLIKGFFNSLLNACHTCPSPPNMILLRDISYFNLLN